LNGYETVLAACEVADLIESRNGVKFSARCPAHEDRRASLAVSQGAGGKALIYCFAGCDVREIVKYLGMDMRDLFGDQEQYDVAEYIYTDEDYKPLIKVVRKFPKGFTQLRWDQDMWKSRLLDTRRVLYNLPAVIAAEHVWLVEGEKDVESLRAEGVVATTALGGAGKWRDEYTPFLRGKRVDIIADNDKPGIESASRAKNALRGIAKGLDVWVSPVGKDVTDLLNSGKGLRDLERHINTDEGNFEPMDWDEYKIEKVDWLLDKYIPVNSRVMAFGAAGSLKSLWAMWAAVQLCKEGHKCAYFSLEMPPREVAKRLKKMDPPKDKFKLFRRLSFDSQMDLAAACDLLKGYSLIVVDSWSAVHGDTNNNDAVAKLDREFFLPLIEETGATLLILDNTGQAMLTDRGKIQSDWARGASAKGDKMDMTLFFERPDEMDNHTTRIKVKKIRGDSAMPRPIVVRTDADVIDFRVIDEQGVDLGSMWDHDGEIPEPPKQVPDAPKSLLERLEEARLKARLKEGEI